jgi:hypothetical protein
MKEGSPRLGRVESRTSGCPTCGGGSYRDVVDNYIDDIRRENDGIRYDLSDRVNVPMLHGLPPPNRGGLWRRTARELVDENRL